MSNDEAEFLEGVVRNHMRPETLQAAAGVTPRAAHRFFRACGTAGIGAILLSLADLLGKYAASPPQAEWAGRVGVSRSLLEAFYEQHALIVEPPRLLGGEEIMRELELAPGPQIGRLLEVLREAQAAGGVTTREEAVAFLRATLAGNGLADEER